MKAIAARTAALLMALAAAVAVFVVFAWFRLGFWPLALLALLAFFASGFMLINLADRWSSNADRGAVPGPRREDSRASVWRWLLGGTVAYVVVAQLAVGRPPQRTLLAPEPAPGTKYWTLGNGSRIAYLMSAAKGRTPKHESPVIHLHDGPGMPALPVNNTLGVRPLDFLTEEGYDVYYYDQLGAGLSERLDLRNEQPYTVARHVEDLENIRRVLGARTLILAGSGWGATLAVNYLLAHADNVERLILESPGPLWYPAWRDLVEPTARARMTDVQASALAALERPPLRLVIGRMMADFSPRSAHTLVADWEGDQWWTKTTAQALSLGQPRMTCLSDPTTGLAPLSGLGFFANTYTLADALRLPDPRAALRKIRKPALVLRGTCDYIDWKVSYEYLDVLPGSRYVAVPAAGHQIWMEQPSLRTTIIRAYLRGESVPLEMYTPPRE